MSTDPAGIPVMAMISAEYGYDLIPASRLSPRPAHRAVMDAAGAAKNLAAKAGIRLWEMRGAHWAPLTEPAAWAAEEAAQVREILRVPR